MKATGRLLELLGVTLPVIQAPMAGAQDEELACAVAEAGGLGSLPCAFLTPESLKKQVQAFRARTPAPVNLNFFCHSAPADDPALDADWRAALVPFYRELGVAVETSGSAPIRLPFNDDMCQAVEEVKPRVVSFHFGLPPADLLARARATGATILCSATSVAEARQLEAQGVDAVIAQGYEAGGHRGMFLSGDPASQIGTFALIPQLVDAVKVPVIASGGIADARGVAAAFALGASAVQVGTAYLRCPESRITTMHRQALATAQGDETRLTNVFTGRPARGIQNRIVRERGPLSQVAPPFPLAARALAPLRSRAEASGSSDFSPLWAGQAVALSRELSARELTLLLASGVPDAGER
jgi:nitronate monooxygenase